MGRKLVGIKVMQFKYLRVLLFFVGALLPFVCTASEPQCITTIFLGTDTEFENAVQKQLKTELTVPIFNQNNPGVCWPLSIAIKNQVAHISLKQHQLYNSNINTGDVSPELLPRAIALATTGLLVLAQSPKNQISSPHDPDADDRKTQIGASSQGNPETKDEKTPGQQITPTQIEYGSSPLQFHLMTGMRFIPQLRVGIFELSTGIGMTISNVQLDLCVWGLWGRKSLKAGHIITTGGGFRTSIFWLILNRQRVSLGIGPAIEAIGVFGYGRGIENVDSHQDFSPVINFLLLAGGWFELTPKVRAHVVIGGGASALHFNMQVDGETASGISGGFVNFAFGLSFGRSN